MTIEAGTIWRSILEQRRVSVAAHAWAGIEPQPLPDDLFAVLERVHALAAEQRPLNLADHRAFWQDPPEDRFITCNLIQAALTDYSRRPLVPDDRAFLDHWTRCISYLASQGHQGIEGDRDHWDEDYS